MGQGKAKAHDIGRWAHFNVKLHLFLNLPSLNHIETHVDRRDWYICVFNLEH